MFSRNLVKRDLMRILSLILLAACCLGCQPVSTQPSKPKDVFPYLVGKTIESVEMPNERTIVIQTDGGLLQVRSYKYPLKFNGE